MNGTEICHRCGFELQMTESTCPFCIHETTPEPVANSDTESSPVVYEVEYAACPICGTREGFQANYCSICRLAVGISQPVPDSMLTKQSEFPGFNWSNRVTVFAQEQVVPVCKKVAFPLFAKIPGSIFLFEYLGTRAKRRAERKLERKVQEIETKTAEKSALLESRFTNKAESKQEEFIHERQQDVLIVKRALRQLDDLVDPHLNC